ncbi:putative E3 ubiquitin-protein ligase UBR7 isoform X1 [Stylophora pistillata]|uniref:putative E3 ubiquitin-protein ligase UBR7 isoform X1 n=1 Tax=Stylophora pistillata TaxID=50429 RepID=UPI000C04EAA5|nr:putative E3 ubiquitin-protein ligase UBR7 isoform X1 [Stylophora pistillata]
MEAGVFEDQVVSMVDVLDEDNELEEEARAVLGDSDDKNCTYLAGYVKRQALYACSTCSPADNEPAGICLACTLACHDGHVLYELYTKRNFRCDCGNEKFGGFTCKLYSGKDAENSINKYNQNFRGVYCTCQRPYPDLEDEIEDEMIQCIICEDWYHSRHLGSLPPIGGEFQEMICDNCMTKCSFLQAYLSLSVPQQKSSIDPNQQVDIKQETESKLDIEKTNDLDGGNASVSEKGYHDSKCSGEGSDQQDCFRPESTETPHSDSQKPICSGKSDCWKTTVGKETKSAANDCNASKLENSLADCKLVQLQASVTTVENKATYWHTGWRSNLCKCENCISLYRSLDVLYLTDESDTMVAYEKRGREKTSSVSSYESGMQALQNMARIPQVEVMHGYNDMKNELTEYLKGFVEQGKVVKEEDIRNFFDSLQSRKRQRVGSGDSVQYRCR